MREENGHVVFTAAVARIAETISPLGTVARIVAEVAATKVELRRLAEEGKQVEADRMTELLRLKHRKQTAGQSINAMNRMVALTEVESKRFRDALANAEKAVFERGVSLAEKEAYISILDMYSSRMVENHIGSGNVLTAQISEVLNGDGALAPGQRSSQSPGQRQNQPSTQRQNQQKRQNQPPSQSQRQTQQKRRRPRPRPDSA